jgi:hypothetical protein
MEQSSQKTCFGGSEPARRAAPVVADRFPLLTIVRRATRRPWLLGELGDGCSAFSAASAFPRPVLDVNVLREKKPRPR